jgi:hypothetical protein
MLFQAVTDSSSVLSSPKSPSGSRAFSGADTGTSIPVSSSNVLISDSNALFSEA